MPLSLLCFLQERNSRSLESDFTYCAVQTQETEKRDAWSTSGNPSDVLLWFLRALSCCGSVSCSVSRYERVSEVLSHQKTGGLKL